jgi:hypothetical protein
MEIPSVVKQRLGLDSGRSWIILNEGSDFLWPGPDLRPQPGKDMSSAAYGFLPPNFFSELQKRFVDLATAGNSKAITRDP